MTDPVDRSVLDALVARLGDRGPGFRSSLVGTWATEAEVRREELARCAETGDAVGLARLAHTLRSAGGSLGATTLAALCETVEDACRTGSGDVVGLAAQVRLELDRADAALQALATE